MKLEADVDRNMLDSAWKGLGLYISRQVRMGRAVSVPKFGVITFAAPEIKLEVFQI